MKQTRITEAQIVDILAQARGREQRNLMVETLRRVSASRISGPASESKMRFTELTGRLLAGDGARLLMNRLHGMNNRGREVASTLKMAPSPNPSRAPLWRRRLGCSRTS